MILYPHRDSNPDSRFRKPVLYPLSYEGFSRTAPLTNTARNPLNPSNIKERFMTLQKYEKFLNHARFFQKNCIFKLTSSISNYCKFCCMHQHMYADYQNQQPFPHVFSVTSTAAITSMTLWMENTSLSRTPLSISIQ